MKNLSLLSRVFMFGLFLSSVSLLDSYSLSPAYAATSTSVTSTTQLASLERQIATITRTSNNLISSIKSLGTIRARLIKSISTLSDGSATRARLAKQLEATEKRILSQYKQLLAYRAQIADIQKKIAQIKSPPVVTSTGVTVPGSSSNTSSQGGGSSGGSTGGGSSQTSGTTPSTSGTTSTTGGTTTSNTATGTNTATAATFTVNGVQFSSTPCARENGVCTISGRRYVAYGSGTSYTVRVYQNSVSCGNRDFVDPIFGVEKACYLSVSTTTAALSSTTTTPTPTTTATGTNTSTATGTNTNTATGSNTNTATGTNTTGGSTTTPPPTTTTTNGAISLRLAASRVTGTAPLAVHFDASDTTTTIAGVQPFHDIRYEFNFGDDRGQNWTISGLSKNTQTGGPIAAHVFDVPGVYTVRVRAIRAGVPTVETTVTVTVTSGDTTFQGQSTVCVSSASNFTGCPTGAQQLTFLPASSVLNNRRLLLRRGETFGAISISHGVRNVQIGAYGTGNKPRVSRVDIGTLSPSSSAFPEDITIMDLNIQQQLAQYVTMSRLLVYNNDFAIPTDTGVTQIELASALGYIVDNHTLPQSQYYQPRELFVVGNYVHGTTTTAFVNMTGEGSKFVIMGNDIGIAQQHSIRIWAMNRGFIAHNALRGGSSDGIRVSLKLQSGGFGEYNDNYAISNSTWATRKVVIANNRLGDTADNNSFIGGASPENTESGQGLEDVILENNTFVRGPNTNTEFILMGRRMTTRGNTRLDGGVPNINQFGNQYQLIPASWNGPYYVQ